jgi:hypothetical protein
MVEKRNETFTDAGDDIRTDATDIWTVGETKHRFYLIKQIGIS